jgi:hypothetical protein
MTQSKLQIKSSALDAIIMAPETELKEILIETLKLIRINPEILARIDHDIELEAKQQKIYRLEEKSWYENLNGTIPGIGLSFLPSERIRENMELKIGRPRLLDAESTFLMIMCRANLDSVKSKQAHDRLKDSKVVNDYFEARGMRLPSVNTILDHINAVSPETLEYVFNSQIRTIIAQGLDPMELVAIDSFSVSGNTEWPTDSRILIGLLKRIFRLCAYRIEKYGLPGISEMYLVKWLKELKRLDFEIACTAGKAKSKTKIRKLYRRFLRMVDKILLRMIRQISDCMPQWETRVLPPNKERIVAAIIDQIIKDVHGVIRVYTYAQDRVFHGIVLPAPEKILSLSDESAAFIKKGNREAVIGYKPQIARSGAGFITSKEVIHGNPADSDRLMPIMKQHIKNVGFAPTVVTVDDGYSSASNRRQLLKMGVKVVSINGAKGKKITPSKDWDSDEYKEARDARSAVESIISVLRYKFFMCDFTRRGLKAVQSELTEKTIAHNFWRMAYLKKKPELKQAA